MRSGILAFSDIYLPAPLQPVPASRYSHFPELYALPLLPVHLTEVQPCQELQQDREDSPPDGSSDPLGETVLLLSQKTGWLLPIVPLKVIPCRVDYNSRSLIDGSLPQQYAQPAGNPGALFSNLLSPPRFGQGRYMRQQWHSYRQHDCIYRTPLDTPFLPLSVLLVYDRYAPECSDSSQCNIH